MRLILTLALIPLPLWAEVAQGPPNTSFAPAFAGQTRADALPATAVTAGVFANGLDSPWGIAALPDGRFIVTEKPGAMRIVAADGSVGPPLAELPEVALWGQGGLLDVTVAPDFGTEPRVWWTYAAGVGDGAATTVATGLLVGKGLTDVQVLWQQSPAGTSDVHFGSRVVVAGDYLFVTAGERGMHQDPAVVQDPGNGLGKVIRLLRDGSVPADNPFGTAIWSTGHRNPQGATIGPDGALWTVEHGPQGGDELNRPAPGANHGWPLVSYGEDYSGTPIGDGLPRAADYVEPLYYWDPVIAPGGMAFYQGTLFPDWQGDLLIGSLNPGGLVRLRLDGQQVVGEERILDGAARFRDVEVLGDGSLLILTDHGEIWRITPG